MRYLENSKLQKLMKVIVIEKKAGIRMGTKIPARWASVLDKLVQ